MSEIVCDSCGVANAPGTEFCTGCGSFLDWEGATTGPGTRPIPPAASPPAPAGGPAGPGPAGAPPPPAPPAAPPTWPVPPAAGPGTWPVPDPTPRPRPPAAGPLGATEVGYRLIVPQGAPPPPGLGPGDGDPLTPGSIGRAAAGGAGTAVLQGEPVAPGTCPDCGRVNPPELRFCAKCGYRFPDRETVGSASGVDAADHVPWWRRWFTRRRLGTASARRSFRRSLPARYRVRRYIISGVVLLLVIAALFVSGHNPVGWVSDRIADLRGTLVPVTGLTATGEPQDSVLADHPPGYAIDNLADTAWGTAWPGNPASPVAPGDCVATASAPPAGSAGTLLLTLPSPKKIRAIEVAAGLTADDPLRSHQWLPKSLELSFSDGQCQQVALADVADLQRIQIEPVTTSQVRIQVVDAAAPPPDQPINVVALSEVRLLARP